MAIVNSPIYSSKRNTIIRPDDLALMLSYAEQAPPGAFVEVGVYRGGSARELYEVAERQGRTLWLFDTFEGHPMPCEYDAPQHPAGRYADCADPSDLRREMPNAHIVQCRFPGDLWWMAECGPVAFAHIDVDLYEGTRDAITYLAGWMATGGVMYFDDYGVPECPGASLAVRQQFGVCVEVLANGKALTRFPL